MLCLFYTSLNEACGPTVQWPLNLCNRLSLFDKKRENFSKEIGIQFLELGRIFINSQGKPLFAPEALIFGSDPTYPQGLISKQQLYWLYWQIPSWLNTFMGLIHAKYATIILLPVLPATLLPEVGPNQSGGSLTHWAISPNEPGWGKINGIWGWSQASHSHPECKLR